MIKSGICTLEDLRTLSLSPSSSSKACFIGLYRELMTIEPAAASQMRETVLRSFSVRNGTFKRTSCKRTSQFDREVLGVLRSNLASPDQHIVHDMGVSDARTSCDFFEAFSAYNGVEPEFFATDLCFNVIALRREHTRTTVVVDHCNSVLQIMFPPFVLSSRSGVRDHCLFPINTLLRVLLTHTSVKQILRLYKVGDHSVSCRAISLISPEAQRLAARTCRFHLEQYDAFENAPRKYSIVRAMNLFNRSYFSDAIIFKGIENVLGSLSDRGAFIIGSNGDSGSIVNGSVYVKRCGRFHRIYTSGKGSEIDGLVLKAEQLLTA